MLYIVYLFYIWYDSIVEVGFDVCDMYVWVGILLMCLSFCSLKKKKYGIFENLGGGVCSVFILI